MSEKTYNGYANYETWAVQLWLDNDQGSQGYWSEAAEEIWESAEPTEALSKSESARFTLTDRLKSEIEEGVPQITGLYADLLNAALSEVDWADAADNWLQECEGYEAAE
jgi:hypothetical protein